MTRLISTQEKLNGYISAVTTGTEVSGDVLKLSGECSLEGDLLTLLMTSPPKNILTYDFSGLKSAKVTLRHLTLLAQKLDLVASKHKITLILNESDYTALNKDIDSLADDRKNALLEIFEISKN